ncbi:MAG: RNA polymerase subunit sigma-70 [Phycisphaerales bacterium]|nr:RNA polymerase subunit sigma-70 [Phycisphaerales bacterium]NNM26353.1 RNA polymerase subunit sigma-70 [Phycisphaerales bacterium]
MTDPAAGNVTRLLHDAGRGDRGASDRVMELLYDDLRRLAVAKLGDMPPAATLQPTALINECYLRLVDKEIDYADRLHFFRLAGKVMRGIVVDYTRRHQTQKRGGGRHRVTLEIADRDGDRAVGEMAAVSEAMERLADRDAEAADVVLLKYFTGLSHGQVAEAKGISEARARRLWKLGTTLLAEILELE